MSFAIYFVGFLILIEGVAWALVTAGVRPLYVGITSVILLGLSLIIRCAFDLAPEQPTRRQ